MPRKTSQVVSKNSQKSQKYKSKKEDATFYNATSFAQISAISKEKKSRLLLKLQTKKNACCKLSNASKFFASAIIWLFLF